MCSSAQYRLKFPNFGGWYGPEMLRQHAANTPLGPAIAASLAKLMSRSRISPPHLDAIRVGICQHGVIRMGL